MSGGKGKAAGGSARQSAQQSALHAVVRDMVKQLSVEKLRDLMQQETKKARGKRPADAGKEEEGGTKRRRIQPKVSQGELTEAEMIKNSEVLGQLINPKSPVSTDGSDRGSSLDSFVEDDMEPTDLVSKKSKQSKKNKTSAPNKKRSPNAFWLFSDENRETAMRNLGWTGNKEDQKPRITEVSKELGRMWKAYKETHGETEERNDYVRQAKLLQNDAGSAAADLSAARYVSASAVLRQGADASNATGLSAAAATVEQAREAVEAALLSGVASAAARGKQPANAEPAVQPAVQPVRIKTEKNTVAVHAQAVLAPAQDKDVQTDYTLGPDENDIGKMLADKHFVEEMKAAWQTHIQQKAAKVLQAALRAFVSRQKAAKVLQAALRAFMARRRHTYVCKALHLLGKHEHSEAAEKFYKDCTQTRGPPEQWTTVLDRNAAGQMVDLTQEQSATNSAIQQEFGAYLKEARQHAKRMSVQVAADDGSAKQPEVMTLEETQAPNDE